MTLRRAFLSTWLAGLVLFAIVIALSLPLAIPCVPGGIMDHQAAGTAAEVDRIQRAWRLAGLWNRATIAMIGDLVFIGIYGAGSVLAGLHFRRAPTAGLRLLGKGIVAAGVLFLVSDYAETVSELIQLIRFEGDDGLATLAATVRPVKLVVWVATLMGVIAALVGQHWLSARA